MKKTVGDGKLIIISISYDKCQSYGRFTTDVSFTKHLTKDARLFSQVAYNSLVKSSEIVFVH